MQTLTIILIIDAVLLVGLFAFMVGRSVIVGKRETNNVKDETRSPDDVVLSLNGIVKVYGEGDNKVKALKGIDLAFRRSEFVSVLGPSGCGKTTMLNIVGGLDHYTEGDLIINGTSTKEYKDRDWDTYRNHSVGFVFQSYNLIPHQTVLQNVELALTLSGVDKSQRKKRVISALEKVGLKDQIHKKPNQLSGGQMQRVAIARALVNDPEIILADEPTGALDSETSVQVMELLKEVSKERLVIMVTHNPELAERYSSRIIKIVDGSILDDSSPVPVIAEVKKRDKKEKKVKKPSMSFFTAFRLSLKNLFTKKGRTILTSFAGSIGIIGIALILAVSQGTTGYINHIQESTLASYPLTIQSTSTDLSTLMKAFMSAGKNGEHENDAVYKETVIGDLVNALVKTKTGDNDLNSFKTYLDGEMKKTDSSLYQAVSGVQYTYDMTPLIYTKNIDGKVIKSDANEVMSKMLSQFFSGSLTSGEETSSLSGSSTLSALMGGSLSSGTWQELLKGNNGETVNGMIKNQYEVVYGSWPNDYDEVVLVLNENNELDDLTLYALGLISQEEIDKIMESVINGTEYVVTSQKWSYEEICARNYRTILPADCYKKVGDTFVDFSQTESGLNVLYQNGVDLKVKGIIRPKETTDSPMLSGAIGYTHQLTEYIIKEAAKSPVVIAQLENPNVDVLTGLPFKSNTGSLSDQQKKAAFLEYVNGLEDEAKAEMFVKISSVMTEEQLQAQTEAVLSTYTDRTALEAAIAGALSAETGLAPEQIQSYLAGMTEQELKSLITPLLQEQIKTQYAESVKNSLSSMSVAEKVNALNAALPVYTTEQCALYYDEAMTFSDNSLEDNLKTFGAVDLATPSSVSIYVSTFDDKSVVENAIETYNDGVEEGKKIKYTDYVGLLMGSVTQIIDAVTYVLIAFVAISLVVSSIMIGVITLISVQERTKEIGILRAIGASKKDVSSMFNAETIIIGFASGLFGVLITYLLCIPINVILRSLTGLATLKATLPISAAAILVGISVLLTLISGIIPSRSAAKKDPVVALRTE